MFVFSDTPHLLITVQNRLYEKNQLLVSLNFLSSKLNLVQLLIFNSTLTIGASFKKSNKMGGTLPEHFKNRS